MYNLILGDIGTLLQFTIYENDCHKIADLTSALSAVLYIQFPDGCTTQSHSCYFSSPQTCGIVNYATVEGDFPIVGTYRLQVVVTFSNTQIFNSDVVSLRVGGNIIPELEGGNG